jgi:hypothetical protein
MSTGVAIKFAVYHITHRDDELQLLPVQQPFRQLPPSVTFCSCTTDQATAAIAAPPFWLLAGRWPLEQL